MADIQLDIDSPPTILPVQHTMRDGSGPHSLGAGLCTLSNKDPPQGQTLGAPYQKYDIEEASRSKTSSEKKIWLSKGEDS